MSTAKLLAGREVLGAGLTSLRASFTVSPVGEFGCLGRFLFACFDSPPFFVVLHIMLQLTVTNRTSQYFSKIALNDKKVKRMIFFFAGDSAS